MPDASSANGNFAAPDCPGCVFPAKTASACASTAPAINIVYPPDNVLVPPNMNVISVQWTPFGGYTQYEVDFTNSITDTRVVTKCSAQTWDTGQPPMQSGGCELIVDPKTWTFLVNANRGGDPVTVTVRGTTDGMCASSSMNSVKMSFASDDVLGAIYYWKSTITTNGVGGQIWVKSFGDSIPEQQVTGNSNSAFGASCNGCHSLSRDGLRMVLYSDDDDSDDEYGDVTGSLFDMTARMPIGMAYQGRGSGQPPGFSTLYPDHSLYVTSNGLPNNPTNTFGLWSGNDGNTLATVTFGTAGDRPTMPDWSPDGKSVIYVLPNKVAAWDPGGSPGSGGARNDDDHVFGGSLYTIQYFGNNQFGGPTPFLKSGGENNYYPSYSPDGQFVAFDRAPHDTSVATIDGCSGTAPQRACPNDSFSNPAARVMLVPNSAGGTPIDLENANGSAASAPVPLSNSWPRWSPFLQQYKGNMLLWMAFSSTRDYGIRVRNHKAGMYQCYPADSFEDPGAAHHQSFAAACQQPQLWMAAINLSAAAGTDPSRVAFWLPFQDITTHNHTPQWTQAVAPPPPGSGGSSSGSSSGASGSSGSGSGSSSGGSGGCIPTSGNCTQNPGACCAGSSCQANGTCQPLIF